MFDPKDGPRPFAEKGSRRRRNEWLRALAGAPDFGAAFAVCLDFATDPRAGGGEEMEALLRALMAAAPLVARRDEMVAFARMLRREGFLASEDAFDSAAAMADGMLACWLEEKGLDTFAQALEGGDYTRMLLPAGVRLARSGDDGGEARPPRAG
jgi:hypothetical protein